jgi:hypothetical protein
MNAPLDQATEGELLMRARAAMTRAAKAAPGSLARSVQWAAYDTVMAEMDRRALGWAASAPPGALRELGAWLAAGRASRRSAP